MQIVPAAELDPEGLASALAVVQAEDRRAYPDIEPTTADELRQYVVDDRTDGNRHLRFAALDDTGTVVVFAHLELEQSAENAHFCSAEILGRLQDPPAARAVVAALVDVAEDDGRTTLMGWARSADTEARFWSGLGAVRQYTEQESLLDVTAVDAALMASWIERRRERAADVELVEWDHDCPEPYLDAYATSRTAMNDAPTGELDINDWIMTADDVRADEAARAAVGTRIHTLFAVTADGAPVGHTTVHVNTHRPSASWQWDTVVLDHHRGRGIGRWLKAEMWRRLREGFPAVTFLRTGNAVDNDPMLAINRAMGFRPTNRVDGWGAALAVYRQALSRP